MTLSIVFTTVSIILVGLVLVSRTLSETCISLRRAKLIRSYELTVKAIAEGSQGR